MFGDRDRLGVTAAREVALDCAAAGIDAAHPETVVADRLSVDDGTLVVDGHRTRLADVDRVIVVGGGNAAGTAAAALEAVLGDRIDEGLVVTDQPAPTETVRTLAGGHPVPTPEGVEHTERMLAAVDEAGPDDLVVALVTGGGSALLCAPARQVGLGALRTVTDALLGSGADIREINAVRKHLSRVKGGRLAARAAPARIRSLVFSDVVGSPLDVIASGPTAPDATTFADALAVLDRHDVDAPDAVRAYLERGADGTVPETPTTLSDPSATHHVLADNMTALTGAADAAEKRGYRPLVLSSRVRGEASEVALSLVGIGEECAVTGAPVEPPAVLLSGGETTVRNPGDGRGGPNQEFALRVAVELDGPEQTVLSVDTDGIDGPTSAAGSLVDGRTVEDADAALDALAAHEAGPALAERDALLETGPTGTNVNDLRVQVIGGPGSEGAGDRGGGRRGGR